MGPIICLAKNPATGVFEILLDYTTRREALANMKDWAEDFVLDHRREPVHGQDYLVVEMLPEAETRFELEHIWDELSRGDPRAA